MELARRIERSPKALAALADIYSYTKLQWNETQAQSYLHRFDQTFMLLASSPNIGHRHPDIPVPLLTYSVGSHLVISRADERTLYIIAILHGAMDSGSRLDDLLTKQRLHS